MQTVTLPNSRLSVSAISLGTAIFGNGIPDTQAFRLLDTFVAGGGTAIDTASVYADWLPGERSSSEKCIGRWLRRSRKRDRIILATKGGHPHLESMHLSRLSPAQIRDDLENSLGHLGTETVDLYWLHRDDPARPVAEILEGLNDQVRAGKIRYFGCSNWRAERIAQAQAYATRERIAGFVANQPLWSLATLGTDDLTDPTMTAMDPTLYRLHVDTGLAAMPYSSQANGWFQKELARVGTAGGRYDSPENRARLGRVQRLAEQTGLTVTQIVLGYLRGQPFPTVPIVGCRTVDQLTDSLSAGEVALTQEQIAFLEHDPGPSRA